MFWKLFGRKKKNVREVLKVAICPDNSVLAYVSGKVIPIEQCGEKMFAQKTLGDGVVILPNDGKIIAPFDCEVVMAFATGHAFGLRSKNGVECMLHLGIDTVHLAEPVFKPQAFEGDRVVAGTVLAYADLEAIRRSGKNTAMLCMLTNGDKWKITDKAVDGNVNAGQSVVLSFEKLI
ncbi:MAG: PTS glucose transporter subunit IIA [Negativicutes bacterium]|jgi:glucose-specific phosphotransferase system IIA component